MARRRKRPAEKPARSKTRRKPILRNEYDPPWKEMLKDNFEAALAFFFPDVWADVDWQRSYTSLDKELNKIMRNAGVGKRIADLLIKVWLKNGEERFVLIHVEVQGQKEEDFSERMFLYNVRVFDVYRRQLGKAPEVVSFALLTDDNPDWNPTGYRYGHWNAETSIRFRTVKLREYNRRWAELEADPNPFATVVMAYLKARETRKDFPSRLVWKHRLVRQLYERGMGRQQVLDLFRFIDWVMALPAELDEEFWNEHLRYEAEQEMRYVTSVERIGIRKGRKEGKMSLLKEMLVHRFSDLPAWAEKMLAEAGQEDLERWGLRLLDATTLEDVFATT